MVKEEGIVKFKEYWIGFRIFWVPSRKENLFKWKIKIGGSLSNWADLEALTSLEEESFTPSIISGEQNQEIASSKVFTWGC